jgi:subtilase family serine protease
LVRAQHAIFSQGAAQGIAFVGGSGDFGAFGCGYVGGGRTFAPSVSYPNTDPYFTSVGGTNLQTTASGLHSAYVSESMFPNPLIPYYGNAVWGPGGGISELFPRPWYQSLVNSHSTMRTVPDISMHMGGCPITAVSCAGNESSILFVVNGQWFAGIGTSSSAPEFAGLLAIAQQHFGGRFGPANPLIYAESALQTRTGKPFFHANIPGNNGYYQATPGYNYVFGVGTPIGLNFIFDPDAPPAGDTLSLSNP